MKSIKKYWMMIKNTWAEMTTYRLNFILWRVRIVIRFLITYFLWASIFSDNQLLFGYTREMMLTYVVMIYLLGNFIFATKTEEIGAEINEGKLSNYLLKPISYFKSLIVRDLSDKILNLAFTIVEVVILFAVLDPPFFIQTDIGLLALVIVSIFGSIAIYFTISLLLGFTGFWTSEIWATRFIFMILLDFLAGNFFPIDIYPGLVRTILQLTPFPYLVYFPVKLYLGQLTGIEISIGFLVLGIWIVLLWHLTKYVWKKGLRVYGAEGR